MQKVRTTLLRYWAAIMIGALTWCTVVLLPQDAGGLSTSYLQAMAFDSSAQLSNFYSDPSDAVTIRVQGVPYTYNTSASQSTPLPALKPLTTKPAAPTGLKVVSTGSNRVELSWQANSEADLKGYRVAYKPAGGTYQSFFTTSTKCTITGLQNGIKYTLKVKAQNTSDEYSSYSSHVYATPKSTPPSTPSGLKVTSIGNGRIDVAWNPNKGSDLKQYRLAYKPEGGSYKSVFTSGTSYSLTGLTNGKKYTLKVKAINEAGEESNYCSFVYATPTGSSPAPSKANVKVETLAAGTKYATPLYVISSGQPGPVVMVVGGVHGNEEAGYSAARKITEYKINRGTLIVIPEANKLAIEANRRAAPGESDLNRAFPQSSSQNPKNVLSRAIYSAIKDYKVDWLIDLHEGYDYYKNSSTDSVGQTLIYYPANSTKTTAQAIVDDLNKGISSSLKKFSLLRYPVKGSLARAAGEYLGVHTMIFETCDNPSLSIRVNYHTQAVNKLLSSLNMR